MIRIARTLRPALALCWALAAGSARAGDDASTFRSPPDSARPWVYWFWMDGNIDRDGITADLASMQRAGIGGLVLMEVDVGIPRGPVAFMSAAWRDLFRHAVTEAKRLGLEITLNAGPGWTGSGGPWVAPESSMQHLVAGEVTVVGPTNLDLVLPRPKPRAPHFVHAPLPPSLREAHATFYRDEALLAIPTPSDDTRLAGIDDKALYYRLPYSSHPGVPSYLPARADVPAAPAGAIVPRERIVDLHRQLESDDRLRWSVPPGSWTLLRFGRTSTGANTRPAPGPGIGLECDKFDPRALDAHFEAFVGPLLHALDGRPSSRGAGWTRLHIDSWEMGAQNWTANFRAEFRRRRGYDPLPYLPAMLGRFVDSAEITERFLWDLRQTAQELVIEHHAGRLKTLARRHGLGLSIEPYDMNPCSDLGLGGVADVPMGEFWSVGYGFDTSFSCLEAVSIAHTRGRPVVAAEAFTADDREAWRLHPGAMKDQADWALALGINRLTFHRFAHQPWATGRAPGMTMGPYGAHYERTQTWWDLAPAWHQYLARCQWMLRRGLPVADVCFLAAEGAPHVFRPPPSALRGSPPLPDRREYSFDGCAPETVLHDMTVRNGRLRLPHGVTYRLLVLPEMDTMTPPLLAKIARLVHQGAAVMGPRPRRSPSLSGHPDCDLEVARLAAELWGDESTDLAPRRVGRGRVFPTRPLPSPATSTAPATTEPMPPPPYPRFEDTIAVLRELGVAPDFESDPPLRFHHRRDAGLDLYFVSNPEPMRRRVDVSFRVTGRPAEWWDPMTGETRRLPESRETGNRTVIPLTLEPHGSGFVVFSGTRRRTAPEPDGSVPSANFPAWRALGDVDGPWEIEFQPDRGAPGRITLPRLISWTDHPDPGVRFFGGLATYRTRFDLPPTLAVTPRERRTFRLDLGRVEVMARVRLNGTDLGTVWKAPYRVAVSTALRPGSNDLEVTVANLWPNRLIGDQSLAPDRRVAWSTWNPYRPDSPLLPSGLLGPVTLETSSVESPPDRP